MYLQHIAAKGSANLLLNQWLRPPMCDSELLQYIRVCELPDVSHEIHEYSYDYFMVTNLKQKLNSIDVYFNF